MVGWPFRAPFFISGLFGFDVWWRGDGGCVGAIFISGLFGFGVWWRGDGGCVGAM